MSEVYEISKEVFKQRLEDRLNFQLIDATDYSKSPATQSFKDVLTIPFNAQFSENLKSKGILPQTNIIVFCLDKHSKDAKKAAELLHGQGFHYTYYYQGNLDDFVLEKGIN